ncbi:PP2C family protein-serine/threonine phosphatase [Pedosphaera parvula]|uniref:Protein serine/threonine phosphatase n=1 Tax=Pedosphaera parvula (strain Ellin514) TaxID=320771 RepID=B9XDP2_PEDPL|nr:protein phosphatase 2C domain-containing protein [Pedosphaera parvula]EEF62188.1 protein serine/threonine phosphatase [Pedosphaera parvula Ellin514]
MIQTAKLIEAGNVELQDRGEIIEQFGTTILVVADGAGGRSGGAEAAQKVIDMVRGNVARLITMDPLACSQLLEEIDREIAADPVAGETTAVIVVVAGDVIVGASVGDSEAWLIGAGSYERLTENQIRKPFLGSGRVNVVSFRKEFREGTLLLGTDGLFKYTGAERICEVVRASDARGAARALVELVRLPSGNLQDDVAVILANG